jgi:hypothetical protein
VQPLRVLLSLAVLSAVAPGSAVAQDYGGELELFGDGALGLGGAFGAVASDPSAAWYNPGGLPFAQSGGSGSLVLDLYERFVLEDGFQSTAAVADLDFADAASVPFFAGGIAHVGRRDARGRKPHALAAVALTPLDVRRRFLDELETDAGTAALGVNILDRLRYYGLGYGFQPLRELGLGVSAFVGLRRLRHEESQVDASSTTLASRQSRVSIDAEYLTFRLGALWHPTRHWRLGLTFQPPAIEVGARGRVAQVFAVRDADGGTTDLERLDDASVSLPRPWRLRLAGAYVDDPVDRHFLLALDVEVTGPIDSHVAVDVSELPQDGPVPPLGLYFAPTFSRGTMLHAATGSELLVADLVPVRVGLFTDVELSSDPSTAQTFQPDRLDLVGATLAVGVQGTGFDFSVGLVGILGYGNVLRPVAASGGGVDGYVRADARSQSLFLFVTGGARAAAGIAASLYEQIRNDDDDDEDEDGEDDEDDEDDRALDRGAPPGR